MFRLRSLLLFPVIAASIFATGSNSIAQAPSNSTPLTLRANSTEANAKTGVVVAKGNVQINYPARQIQATSAQAIYYSNERRIVLTGDVYVLQQGNSLRGETITYLVDEGRFVALPQPNKQVEAIYMIEAPNAPTTPAPAAPAPFSPKSQFQSTTR
ncbi:MAG TPA: LptA/OstA family protein [Leptolyngbya sp.]|jgi:lipopolysaccharide export system protein LptA|nr:LptA/OstA family protein [Leptolyngbya sp.]